MPWQSLSYGNVSPTAFHRHDLSAIIKGKTAVSQYRPPSIFVRLDALSNRLGLGRFFGLAWFASRSAFFGGRHRRWCECQTADQRKKRFFELGDDLADRQHLPFFDVGPW